MNKHTLAVGDDLSTLAEHAGVIVAGHNDAAGETVGDAREKLAAAQERGKEMYGCFREQAVKGAKVADQTVRKNPYQAVGIALGVGALIGYVFSFRRTRNED